MKMNSIRVELCKQADDEHRASIRQYAHTHHHDNVICFARAATNLTDNQFWAIMAHEIGHLIAGYEGSESDANRAANQFFGIKIRYRDSKNGERLETITDKEARKVSRILSKMDFVKRL